MIKEETTEIEEKISKIPIIKIMIPPKISVILTALLNLEINCMK